MAKQRPTFQVILMLLAFSIASLLFAPLLMPESYNWIVHTTSESGAQGIEGAWLARAGFVLYGLAVLLLSVYSRKRWPSVAVLLHVMFGIGMIGNAIFSSKPWEATLPFDLMEDTLHSLMSGLVGTAFSVGVVVMYFQRGPADKLSKLFDVFAVLVSVAVTVAMMGQLGIDGLIQRLMFLVSYLWYAKETFLLQTVNRSHSNN
jgi:hypothetical protein